MLGKSLIFKRLNFLVDGEGSIVLDMSEYLAKLQKIDIQTHRRKLQKSICTEEEISDFFSLTGKLNFLGHSFLPQAAFAASQLQ